MAKIVLKDLIDRTYRNNHCTRFRYILTDDENNFELEFIFSQNKAADRVWTVKIVIPEDVVSETQNYKCVYEMPKSNMDLVLIAETGMRHFKTYLSSEIQAKSYIDMILGEKIQ